MDNNAIESIRMSEVIFLSSRELSKFLFQTSSALFEAIRIARIGWSILYTGMSLNNKILSIIDDGLSRSQFPEGGWANPEETAWAGALISQVKGKDGPSVLKGIQWLKKIRCSDGGWGNHSRDRARIPTTALVLTLLPEAGSDEDYGWVAREWASDLSGSVQLSYKAGFYLLVAGHGSIQGDSELIERTVKHLINDQNDDGGFAPWKNHPIGSDPWSTGVVLWGLSKWIDRVDPAVIERALHWLEVTQLPSGYWPYHYLDEGTSYALIGVVSAMRAMASRK